ncbi:hypothetical protein SCUP515_10656 [Seiridium cupressi]
MWSRPVPPGRRDPCTAVLRHTAYQAQKPGSFTVAALFCTLTGLTVRGPPPPARYHVPMQYAASMSHARFRHAADTIAALALSLVMCYGREDTRLARSGDVALRDEREVSRLPAMILRVQLASDERSSASPASVA